LNVRGYTTLSFAALFFSVADLVQRLVVCPVTRMFPRHRPAMLGKWQRFLSSTLFFILKRIGGADIPPPGRVPGGPGVLILMNHQSLLDIPMAIASVDGVFSRIVTRQRYAKWIPVISHTIRTLQYPVVNPAAKAGKCRRLLEQLDEVARTSAAPLVLFPEGTRTQDGEIGRFRTAGLERILAARDWVVYVLVSDGYWRHAKLTHFLGGMREIEGHLSVLGPFEWKDPTVASGDFTLRMRNLMVDELARVRESKSNLAPSAA
jgi:1-acyl-sn-glycerol-3-phosphate acyltransferase